MTGVVYQRYFIFDVPRSMPLSLGELLDRSPQTEKLLFLHTTSNGPSSPSRIDEKFGSGKLLHRPFRQRINVMEKDSNITMTVEDTASILRNDITVDISRPKNHTINPTNLPDDIFWNLTPILTICHPAVAIPSIYGKSGEGEEGLRVNANARVVFDAYCARRKCRARADRMGMPVIIDVGDLGEDKVARRVRKLVGVDFEGLRCDDESRALKRGVNTVDDKIDLDREVGKWLEEFGQSVATRLRALVDADMPNYEYLKKYELSANYWTSPVMYRHIFVNADV